MGVGMPLCVRPIQERPSNHGLPNKLFTALNFTIGPSLYKLYFSASVTKVRKLMFQFFKNSQNRGNVLSKRDSV